MIILLNILTICGGALAFTEGMLKMWPEGNKPFTCWRCMSLWSGIAVAVICHEGLYAFVPFLFTNLMNRYLWK